MRLLTALAVLALAPFGAAPLAGQAPKKGTAQAGPDKPTASDVKLPAGWAARTDEKGQEKNVKFAATQSGYQVTLGPATILYRPADKVQSPFRVTATITQAKPPEHLEGYGIFIGGQDLGSDAQRYTYFLVRSDGTFLIKRRHGAETQNLTSSWSAHPAILQPDQQGKATNQLEVAVTPMKTSFLVNGKEVYSADPRLIDAKGVAGLRINHNLDLHIATFSVSPQQ